MTLVLTPHLPWNVNFHSFHIFSILTASPREYWGSYMPRVFCLTYCRPLLSMAVTPAIIAAGVEKTGQVGGWTVLLEYSLGLEAVQGRL